MLIERRFTRRGQDPLHDIEFASRSSKISNPDGSVVFEAESVRVPTEWSQVAVDVLAQKYFRKAGVPTRTHAVKEEGVPEWLWRHESDHRKGAQFGGETDAEAVFRRLTGCWTYWGYKHDYFDSEESARAFHDELLFMLSAQMAAPNSPQWFNTGLHWAYGITGPPQGHY
jgi:ribonucleoside-diphosphate reductase alpha chain